MIATETGIELESVEYQPESETYRFGYGEETTPASMAVVAALSEVTNTPPAALKPLHDTVDADALDSLMGVRDAANGDVRVTWTHEEHEITVHSRGTVAVARPEDERTDDRSEGVRQR